MRTIVLAVSLVTAVLTFFLWVAKGARTKAQERKREGATRIPEED